MTSKSEHHKSLRTVSSSSTKQPRSVVQPPKPTNSEAAKQGLSNYRHSSRIIYHCRSSPSSATLLAIERHHCSYNSYQPRCPVTSGNSISSNQSTHAPKKRSNKLDNQTINLTAPPQKNPHHRPPAQPTPYGKRPAIKTCVAGGRDR